jgi:hypothetical protein
LETLRAKGLVYEGQLERPKSLDPHDEWEPVALTLFKSTQFGDDQDRPMKKSDGSWTYFGADAAYHFQKAQHADHLVNIWGADHSGTVKRVQAAVRALTDGRVDLDVKLVQMVRLFRAGEPIKMSKRAGNFVTLADVVREVGRDVVRFMMLTKRTDSMLDFDFAKVVEASRTTRFSTSSMPMPGSARSSARPPRPGCPSTNPPSCRCSTVKNWHWSGSRRSIREWWKARRWPMSRTASPSISMTWRQLSMHCGTAAMTTLHAAFSLKIIHNFLAPGWNLRAELGR